MFTSFFKKPTSKYTQNYKYDLPMLNLPSVCGIICQCYLIGPVHVYVAINPYSKYVYRYLSIHKSCFDVYSHIL